MYLLKFLTAAPGHTGSVHVEYRLACSGELANRRVLTAGDYRKSDVSRVLLRKPIELFVVSRPFDKYPQELSARVALDYVTEEAGNSTSTFLPDEDVIEDLCSVLSLLSRRLISPICKTRQQEERNHDDPDKNVFGSYSSDFPTPILDQQPPTTWKPRPFSVLTSMDGQKVIDHRPPTVGVNPWSLSEFLLQLPKIHKADQMVYAARLYRTSLELIEIRPDIAYLLLISTVESPADVALGDYDPDEREKLETKRLSSCVRSISG